MINEILSIIKNKLNGYFKLITSSSADQVVYMDGTKAEPLIFPANSIVPLLINIEEEKIIRQANRYDGVIRNGIKTDLSPSIGINMLVLFVSSFADYDQSLKFLSLLISYFQKQPVIDGYNTPALPDSVDKVLIELVTLPLSQRNELWSSLKTTYLPSVIYKIGVLVYRDDTPAASGQSIKDIQLKTVTALK